MSNWVKVRKPNKEYPKTSQQKKIRTAGKIVSKLCKGKKKAEFRACRHEVMQCVFHNEKCTQEVVEAKKEVEGKSS